jgi:hypothetical protein
MIRKVITFAGLATLTTLSTGTPITEAAETPKVEVMVDASTSMKHYTKETKELFKQLQKYFEGKGLKTEHNAFGAKIRKLEGIESYDPKDLDTNYAELLGHLEERKKTATVILTDGRVPTKRLKDVRKIEEEGALLNDAGNVICVLTPKEPTKIIKDFASVAGTYEEYKKVLDDCLQTWEALHGEGRGVTAQAVKPAPVPADLIKTVNEKGFAALGKGSPGQATIKTSGDTQVEVIIKTK